MNKSELNVITTLQNEVRNLTEEKNQLKKRISRMSKIKMVLEVFFLY